MASAILSPHQGTDFTALCLSSEKAKSRTTGCIVMAIYLSVVGIAFSEVVYNYPDPVKIAISGSYGLVFLFVCGWIFYKQVSEAQPTKSIDAIDV